MEKLELLQKQILSIYATPFNFIFTSLLVLFAADLSLRTGNVRYRNNFHKANKSLAHTYNNP